MDKKTRGAIEEALDYALEQDMLEVVNWILEEDVIISSPEDLALGYFLGSLMRFARDTVRKGKLAKSQKKISEKRLGKEKGRRLWKEMEEVGEKMKPTRVDLTEKETNQLREMLIRRIPRYREKILREVHR